MNFLAFPFPPAAGAAGSASRVRLPPAGHAGFVFPELSGKARPAVLAAAVQGCSHGAHAQHRSQHRAQCRAACMSKANF